MECALTRSKRRWIELTAQSARGGLTSLGVLKSVRHVDDPELIIAHGGDFATAMVSLPPFLRCVQSAN